MFGKPHTAAVAAGLLLTTLAVAPATASDQLTINMTATPRVVFGGKATITFNVNFPTGLSKTGLTLILERSVAGGPWRPDRWTTAVRSSDKFTEKVRIHATTRLRIKAELNHPDQYLTATSPTRTVVLTTGTKQQRALNDIESRSCAKYLSTDSDVYSYGGPKDFIVSGKYAYGGGPCAVGKHGPVESGAGQFWLLKGGKWRFYFGTQDTLPCKKFDRKGWPTKITGGRCYDAKTGKERKIKRR